MQRSLVTRRALCGTRWVIPNNSSKLKQKDGALRHRTTDSRTTLRSWYPCSGPAPVTPNASDGQSSGPRTVVAPQSNTVRDLFEGASYARSRCSEKSARPQQGVHHEIPTCNPGLCIVDRDFLIEFDER